MDINYRLGSASYDQDFDFVESYCRWFNKTASEDEMKSLENGYLSALYKYKDKLSRFLDGATLKDLRDVDSYLYEEIRAKSSEDIERLTRERLDKYKKTVFSTLDEILEKLDERSLSRNYRAGRTTKMYWYILSRWIETIQQAFFLLSQGFCLHKIFSNTPIFDAARRNSVIDSGPEFCYLTNDIGLFGFNTWLYAVINGVQLVGVPSNPITKFDAERGCPVKFIDHDYDHISTIKHYNISLPLVKRLYEQIHSDPEATLLQKELLICALWVLVHEDPLRFKIVFTDKFDTRTNSIGLLDEFERFRDLIFVQDFIDSYHTYFKEETKTIEELKDGRGMGSNMWWKYISFYFREYCLKYYDVSEPAKPVPKYDLLTLSDSNEDSSDY